MALVRVKCHVGLIMLIELIKYLPASTKKSTIVRCQHTELGLKLTLKMQPGAISGLNKRYFGKI